MSNKSILQEHNTRLQSGNELLLQAINKANALPNADASTEDLTSELEEQATLIDELLVELDKKTSGETVETCTVTLVNEIEGDYITHTNLYVHQVNPNYKYGSEDDFTYLTSMYTRYTENTLVISVPKNSMIIVHASYDYQPSTSMADWDFRRATLSISENAASVMFGNYIEFKGGYEEFGEVIAVFGDCTITATA